MGFLSLSELVKHLPLPPSILNARIGIRVRLKVWVWVTFVERVSVIDCFIKFMVEIRVRFPL